MTTDQSKAVLVLTSRLGDPSRPSLSPTRWHRVHTTLTDQGIDVAEIFDPNFSVASVAGLKPDDAATIDELRATAAAATIEAAELEQQGISVLTILDDQYPESFRSRLGALAPPVIFTVGNRSLLSGDGIGVVGSRNVDEIGKLCCRSRCSICCRTQQISDLGCCSRRRHACDGRSIQRRRNRRRRARRLVEIQNPQARHPRSDR